MANESSSPPAVFLSYAHADQAKAQRLAAAFEHHGFVVWWDGLIEGGAQFAKSIREALDGALEGGRPMVSITLGAYAAESDVADLLRETEAAHSGVAIGSYPFSKDGRYGANFVMRSEDEAAARECSTALSRTLAAAGFETVEGGI